MLVAGSNLSSPVTRIHQSTIDEKERERERETDRFFNARTIERNQKKLSMFSMTLIPPYRNRTMPREGSALGPKRSSMTK